MTTVIGSVTLDHDMVIEGEFSYSTVNASATPALGGGMIIQEFQALEQGRLITLRSTESMGHQLKSTVDSLKSMAENPGQTFTLTITTRGNTLTKTVRFRHEVDGGPIQFEPFHPFDGYLADSTYYKGTIYLMVI